MRRGDDGNAVIEFIVIAVVVLVPLMYLLVAVAQFQRNRLAVTDAAREAGRAYATAAGPAEAAARVNAAVRLALADQHLPDDATVRFVAADAPCTAAAMTPVLTPGSTFAVCVTRSFVLPAVPTLLAGGGVHTVGRYVVHVDDYRTVGQ